MTLDAASVGKLVSQVQNALGSRSEAAAFAALLYGRMGADGLETFSPEWLARNTKRALAFIAERPIGRHKITIRHLPPAPNGGPTDVACIEILNDDMPFLVDSVMGELQARGVSVRLLLHPIFKTRRDKAGSLQAITGAGDHNWGDGRQESYIAIYTDSISETAVGDLTQALSAILDEVRVVVGDWKAMVTRLSRAADALEAVRDHFATDLMQESLAFLRWLEDGNFTFLGVRDYRLAGDAETGSLEPGKGLGVLRDPAVQVLRRGNELVAMTPEVRRFFFEPVPLIVTKANVVSRVHRRVHMDYIGVKVCGSDGVPAGEVRVVGLFTSQAYVRVPSEIPLLRRKVANVLAASGYPPASHAGKALTNILTTFPRDELFQIGEEQLQEWSEALLDLDSRPRVRVFARVDRFDRFVSLLVYVPRDRYNTSVRERIGTLLAKAYKGRISAFYPFFPEGPLVRVQFIVARTDGPTPILDMIDLEHQVAEIVRTWHDRLAEAIRATGPDAGALLEKYGQAFSAGYAETFPPQRALEDIKRMERLGEDMPVAIDFYRDASGAQSSVRAAIYRFGGPIRLSERVPVLENFGFAAVDERSYRLTPQADGRPREVTLHDMVLATASGEAFDHSANLRLEACFLAVFRGETDNDNFNRLIVSAGADWREVGVLRAYGAYLRQLGTPFGLRYLADTLHRHAGVARDLLELFHLRFDPRRKLDAAARKAAEVPLRQRIEGALGAVPSLDEDRILRQFLNLIEATVRTNFYQTSKAGGPPQAIAFKLDGKAIIAAPEPRTFREIWVYSPRVEGVHLRFGAIARGGIRWTDRAQDFRTEILSLVRAQQVKNAVIVPTGAKGGFLPKRLPRSGSRDDMQTEAIAAYRVFISALLDVTDNLENGKVVAPPRVVRHDGDDPYLVVAADKGTATFSDTANEISLARGFWLGDAFASGGSAGYDHKEMGITARGAWECVKRHFREMDIDIQRQPFRVVGVGDMSGDVFGNGMLLSPVIRLIAAFDHRDIFIDPDPDPELGFAERKRLFALPRSSWQDYERAKISKGGGVFSRSAKAIPMSAEMRALLDVEEATLTPNELIRAVLRCRTDLLWFGGIGTYVRASAERDEDAGDRANDPLRVAATEVRAKVIGEGANLAMTQRARIEFARRGGRLNTDFIDNSAGVNTSDQEVNIKIALGPATRSGRLAATDRGQLLAAMTEDVAAASLRNNYQQSLALSLAERKAARELPDYGLLMRALEARGLFERGLEALPSDAELEERANAGRGLTRPELAVLSSYAKIALQHDLLQSAVPDEPPLETWLTSYFPHQLRDRFAADITGHSLRREIIATGLTNAIVNRGGPAMAVRLAYQTGCTTAEVAYAFMAVREIFNLPRLWLAIDALDGTVSGEAQLRLYQATQDLVNRQTLWFLRDGSASTDLAGTIARHKAGLVALAPAMKMLLPPRHAALVQEEAARLAAAGNPPDLAAEIAQLDALSCAPAVTAIAEDTRAPVADVARIYLEIGELLSFNVLADRADGIAAPGYYDRLAIAQALAQLEAAHATVTRQAVRSGGVEAWISAQGSSFARVRPRLDELAKEGAISLSRLLVAAGQVSELAASAAAPSASARRGR